jgi:hypothetical protein
VHPNSSSLIGNDCQDAFVCERPNGEFVFIATEEECVQLDAECSSLCEGESCMSYRFGENGACFVNVSSEEECILYGVSHTSNTVYSNGVCALEMVTNQSYCLEVFVDSSLEIPFIHPKLLIFSFRRLFGHLAVAFHLVNVMVLVASKCICSVSLICGILVHHLMSVHWVEHAQIGNGHKWLHQRTLLQLVSLETTIAGE